MAGVPDANLRYSAGVAIAFMISVLVLKITAFVLGYLIVRLGHDTMIRGVTGDIDFGFSGEGVEMKLKSAAPGALFVVAGAAIICWGLFVGKPFDMDTDPAPTPAQSQAGAGCRTENKPNEHHRFDLPK